ncbi:MAG: hypothetical protein H6714_05820 [Myxococcales bacterium]|nr:hypothetical protein [Myxococcales bacterium]
MSFARSFETASVDDLSHTLGVGNDVMALVLDQGQQPFAAAQIALLRRPQDGEGDSGGPTANRPLTPIPPIGSS